MKKLITLGLFVVTLMVIAPLTQTVYGQDRPRIVQEERGRKRQVQVNKRRYHRNFDRQSIVMERRYVRIGRKVYRETYRSTYNSYGQLIFRQLISRERVERFERYNDNDYRREGIRFNVYFKF